MLSERLCGRHCSGFASPQCRIEFSTRIWIMTFLGGDGGSRRARRLNIGCWNMRTLVESEDSIATAISRKGGRGVTVDRKGCRS